MSMSKILSWVGIAIAVLAAWSNPTVAGAFGPHAAAVFSFVGAVLVAFNDSVTAQGAAGHKIGWIVVAAAVLGVFAGGAGFVGPEIARWAGVAVTTIAAVTAKPGADVA